MSRTKKGSKGPGYEFWGPRPSKCLTNPNKETKRLTHKLERAKAKAAVRAGKDLPSKVGFS